MFQAIKATKVTEVLKDTRVIFVIEEEEKKLIKKKLDGVGHIDNKPFTDQLYHFVQ